MGISLLMPRGGAERGSELVDELQERAARISTVLENNWSEDFGESLADEQEAANGFALARALCQGWIELSPSLSDAFDAAETFIDDMGEAEDDTD